VKVRRSGVIAFCYQFLTNPFWFEAKEAITLRTIELTKPLKPKNPLQHRYRGF
jgi:hypothetical protein